MTGGAELRMSRPAPQRLPLSSPGTRGRGWLVALFVVYLIMLVSVVLWKLQLPYVGEGELRHIKLVPFAPTTEDGASEPFEVVANLLLFVPFGLYLGLLAPSWSRWKLAGVVASSSLALEVTQWVLSIGSCDVTDLIVNTAGGLAGLGLLILARRRLQDSTVPLMTVVCSIGTVLFLLAAGTFIASPLHYAPIQDVDIRLGSTLESHLEQSHRPVGKLE